MGAGAVGAAFGARLAEAGHRVVFVARGRHLQALQEHGLTLLSRLGDVRLEHPEVVGDPRDAGRADLVLFTVKAQDSQAAAGMIAPIVDADTRILTLQNGVEGVELLRRTFGDERVLGGVAYIEAVIEAPGLIVHKSPFARIVFGPLAGPPGPAEAVRAALEGAGVDVDLVDEPMTAIWSKWVLICAFSGLTALTRMPIGAVTARPETREMLRRAMEEIAALARASGGTLPDDVVETTMRFMTDVAEPTMTSSLAQDLAAGKPLELEALNGAASRLGRELGVPTPVNDLIYAALVLHKDGTA